MKLLDYSGLQRFLSKIKTLLDSKSNTGHTHVTSEVTDLLNSQHTWSAQQSYSADLNLNYTSTDVDDILDTVAGSYTAEDFLAQNNVWSGSNTWTMAQFCSQNAIHVRSAEPGVAPSSEVTAGFRMENANASYAFCDVLGKVNTGGTTYVNLVASNKFSNGALDPNGTTTSRSLQVGIRSDGSGFIYTDCGWRNNLVPPLAESGVYSLGTSTNQWKSVYAQTYYYNGTQWGLDQANEWTSYQQMSCNPTVWNMKNTSLTLGGTAPTSNRYLGFIWLDSEDTDMGRLCVQCNKNGGNYYIMSLKNSDGTTTYDGSLRYYVSRANYRAFYPEVSACDLGASANQWANTYTVNLAVSGTGTCTTPTDGDSSTKIATTEWVTNNFPYKLANTTNKYFEYVNLADSDHIATGFNGMTTAGIYHVRTTADVPGTPVDATVDGILVVYKTGSAANVSSNVRCYQIYYTSSGTRILNRLGSIGSSTTWYVWVEYAKTSDLANYAALASNNRFTSGQIISGNYIGNESSTNARTCITFQSNRDTNGKSGVFFSKFRQNKAQGSMGSGDLVRLSLDILENEVRTNDSFMFRWSGWSSNVPTQISFTPSSVPTSYLGLSGNPWTYIHGTTIYENGTALSSKYALNENFGKGTTTWLYINTSDFPTGSGSSASIQYNNAVDGTKLFAWYSVCNSDGILDIHPTATRVSTTTGQVWRYLGVTVFASGLGHANASPTGILGLFRRES